MSAQGIKFYSNAYGGTNITAKAALYWEEFK